MKDWLVQSQLTNKSETHVSCSPTVTWIFQSKTYHYFQSSSSQYQFSIIHTSNKQQVTIPHAFYSMDSQTKRKFLPVSMSGQRLMAGWRWPSVPPAPTSLYVAWVRVRGAILHMYGTWSNGTNLFFVNIEVDTLFGTLNILPSLERSKQSWS